MKAPWLECGVKGFNEDYKQIQSLQSSLKSDLFQIRLLSWSLGSGQAMDVHDVSLKTFLGLLLKIINNSVEWCRLIQRGFLQLFYIMTTECSSSYTTEICQLLPTLLFHLFNPSIFCTTHPTQGHRKPGIYTVGLRAQAGGHPEQGTSTSQGTI